MLSLFRHQDSSIETTTRHAMIDTHSFRQMMGCFATGITVVTTRDAEGKAVGLTVNSFTSVSLEPPLALFCIDKKAHLYPVFRKTKNFAVNILGEQQEDVSRHFADQHHYAKPKDLWDRPQMECPILKRTLGWIVCRTYAINKGGDHMIMVGEVLKLHKRTTQTRPLLYFHGRYKSLKD